MKGYLQSYTMLITYWLLHNYLTRRDSSEVGSYAECIVISYRIIHAVALAKSRVSTE